MNRLLFFNLLNSNLLKQSHTIRRAYYVPVEPFTIDKVKEKYELPLEIIQLFENYNEKLEKQNKLLEMIYEMLKKM